MYFSVEDRGEMSSMIYNWPADEVDVIVVTGTSAQIDFRYRALGC